ncbi:MAG: hypothetical protein ACHQU1_00950 [Gemmatimonadales bacterium]
MTKRHIGVLLGLLASAGCAGHRASTTGGTYTNQVDTYLARQANVERNQGYSRWVAGPVHGRLANAASTSHQMDVVGGVSYVVFGQCDNDCTDLDLKLYDPDGSVIMQDVAIDDHPTLMFSPKTTGRLRVEVIMAHCNVNPCFYGVELMARP